MQEVHLEAYRKLAEGLVGVGLLKGSADDAVAAGAMYLFMPHGLGHGLGMDVHDCEAMGERSFDFSTIADRAAWEKQITDLLHRHLFSYGQNGAPGVTYILTRLRDIQTARKQAEATARKGK